MGELLGGLVEWLVGGVSIRKRCLYYSSRISIACTGNININIEGKEYNHPVILCILACLKTKSCSGRNYFKCQMEDP